MNNLKQIALNQSKRLGVYMKRLSRVNAALNCHYRERYVDRLNNSNDTIEEFKRRKKENESSFVDSSEGYKSDNSKEMSYSELSIIQHQNKKNKNKIYSHEKFLHFTFGFNIIFNQCKSYH